MDNKTGKRTSLRTGSEEEARQIVEAKNQAERQPVLNLQIAKAYLAGADSNFVRRTWSEVMAEFLKTKTGKNRMRYERAIADNAYDSIRGLHLIETQPEHFLGVLESGSVSTNNYLRGFHNFALDVGRLLRPVLYPVHGYGQSAFESSQVCGHVREQSGNANRPHLCPRQYRICDLVPHLGGAIYASSFFTSLMNTGR